MSRVRRAGAAMPQPIEGAKSRAPRGHAVPGKETMIRSISRRAALGAGLAAAALPGRAHAQRAPIRIGVLTDTAGPYAANTGRGSIIGAQLAVDEFLSAHPDIPVEVVSADLQLK